MESNVTRKVVISGVLGAVAIILGATHWGFIPWFAGAALTIMHVPAIIGAILEGPVVGLSIGLIFGIFSLLQGAIAPTGPTDTWFVNPLISVLPRLLIGPVSWLVYRALEKKHWITAVSLAGVAGSLTNTILVLGMIAVFGFLPWPVIGGVAVTNGIPEAIAGAIITLAVTAGYYGIGNRRKKTEL